MSLASAQAKLLRAAAVQQRPELQPVRVARPLIALPLTPALAVASWAEAPTHAPVDLFPKLGIKSWRDSGSSQVIPRGMPLGPIVEALLARATVPQRVVAGAWRDAGEPLHLFLYPFIDFTDITESRWLVRPGQVRFVSACQRGTSAASLGAALPALRELAARVGALAGGDAHVVELALLPGGAPRLVEVNPALVAAEVDALFAAA